MAVCVCRATAIRFAEGSSPRKRGRSAASRRASGCESIADEERAKTHGVFFPFHSHRVHYAIIVAWLVKVALSTVQGDAIVHSRPESPQDEPSEAPHRRAAATAQAPRMVSGARGRGARDRAPPLPEDRGGRAQRHTSDARPALPSILCRRRPTFREVARAAHGRPRYSRRGATRAASEDGGRMRPHVLTSDTTHVGVTGLR